MLFQVKDHKKHFKLEVNYKANNNSNLNIKTKMPSSFLNWCSLLLTDNISIRSFSDNFLQSNLSNSITAQVFSRAVKANVVLLDCRNEMLTYNAHKNEHFTLIKYVFCNLKKCTPLTVARRDYCKIISLTGTIVVNISFLCSWYIAFISSLIIPESWMDGIFMHSFCNGTMCSI